MHRLPILALVAVLACALAAPADAAFFPGDPVDGPSADVRALGDLDLARDGTGALAWVHAIDGIDRVFVSRFEGGAFQPIDRLDGPAPGPNTQPVVGASDGGRLVVVFVNAGTVYGVVRPGSGQPYSAPTPLGPGSDPSVDLSINGTAFASFTSAGDVRIARLDRRTNAWTGLPLPADVDPARTAGVGTGRSKVAISADGIGIVTWGEAGHVFARKMFHEGISNAPQDLTPPDFGGRVSTVSDLPGVDAEDDSSYAWVVFRQSFADGGSRTLARRQRGTAFDPPVAVDTGDEPVRDPRIELSGRGQGHATSVGATTGQPLTAIIDKRDVFGPGGRVLAPSSVPGVAASAISENNLSIVAAVLAGAAGAAPAVVVRPFDDGKPGPDAVLSRPELGPVDPDGGFDAASDRSGGAVVAWVQGPPAARTIVAGYFDRPPSRFVGYTGQGCCRGVSPTLRWQASFNIWGPTRYEAVVDGAVVGQTANLGFDLPAPLAAGTHTWQVRATDIRGQTTRSKTRLLRVDGRKPLLTVRHRRRKRVVVLTVRARDDATGGRLAAGLEGVVVSWGDGSTTRGKFDIRATHRYPRGKFTLRVTARDKAGNETVDERDLRIGV